MSSKQNVSPLQSVVAGTAAGGLEALVTFPTEYVKTRQQLQRGAKASQSPVRIFTSTVREQGVRSLYTGGASFCVSNAAKSGVRFFSFDFVKESFPKKADDGTLIVATLFAGMAAGIAESFVVLTPGETIKTKMIDDRAGARMYQSASHAARSIVESEGVRGLYRGAWPIAMKQSANAMVRFTSYSFLKDCLGPSLSRYGMPVSMICGSLAGAITVYCTMPFDSVKTQLQSIEGRRLYTGSLDCVRKMVAQGGPQLLWKGTTPRLVRLSVSGALSFSVYEKVVSLMRDLTVDPPTIHERLSQ